MFKLWKTAVSALAALAGLAGVVLSVAPAAAIGQGDTVNHEVSVVADSPWDR